MLRYPNPSYGGVVLLTRRTAVIAKVLQLMKKQWWRILLAVGCAQALSLVVDCYQQISLLRHFNEISGAVALMAEGTNLSIQQAQDALWRVLGQPDVQRIPWLNLAAVFVTPVLLMGLNNFLALMLKDPQNGDGVEGDVRFVFSRWKDCLKAVGCTLLIALRVLLAALPGVALFVALAFLGTMMKSLGVLILSYYGGTILAAVMAVRTAYLYELAPAILAEHTRSGIREALNLSRALMQGHRWEYFTCQLTWYVITLAVELLTGGLTSIGLVMTISVITSVIVSALRLTTAMTFYLIRDAEEGPMKGRHMAKEAVGDQNEETGSKEENEQ